jgi:hypothetical protein
MARTVAEGEPGRKRSSTGRSTAGARWRGPNGVHRAGDGPHRSRTFSLSRSGASGTLSLQLGRQALTDGVTRRAGVVPGWARSAPFGPASSSVPRPFGRLGTTAPTAAVVLLERRPASPVSGRYSPRGQWPVDAWCLWTRPGRPYWRTAYAFLYSPAAAGDDQHAVRSKFRRPPPRAEVLALFAHRSFLPIVVFWRRDDRINAANINLLIVAVAVWGLRWPALWSFVLLTKVTPGSASSGRPPRMAQPRYRPQVTGDRWPRSSTHPLWPDWIAFLRSVDPSDGVPPGPASWQQPPSGLGRGPTDPGWWSWRADRDPAAHLTPAMLVGLLSSSGRTSCSPGPTSG